MGNKISNVTAIAGIDSYVSELGDIYYERRYKETERIQSGGFDMSLIPSCYP